MKSYLRTVHTNTSSYVDPETGELVPYEEKHTKVLVEDRDSFIQIYAALESKLRNLPLAVERVLYYCIFNCDIENLIKINSYDKKVINEKWGIAKSTVSNGIAVLVKEKILIRVERSTYRVHPDYVWKSNSQSRKAMRRHIIEVECPTC